MHKSRYCFIFLCFLIFFGGCEEINPPSTTPEFISREPITTVILNEGITISAGNYTFWELSLSTGWKLSGSITSSATVNIWLLTQREFEAFKNGETFHNISAGSRERTLGFSFTYGVSETQKYYIVVDNKFSSFTSKNVWVYLAVIN